MKLRRMIRTTVILGCLAQSILKATVSEKSSRSPRVKTPRDHQIMHIPSYCIIVNQNSIVDDFIVRESHRLVSLETRLSKQTDLHFPPL